MAKQRRKLASKKNIGNSPATRLQHYEAILAFIPDIVIEVDARKIYTWTNKAGYSFFGPDVIGKEVGEYFADKQDIYSKVKPMFEGKEGIFCVENWQRRKDGAKRLLAWWCQSLKDGNGTVIGALSTARDITDQKTCENAILSNADELERINNDLQRFKKIAIGRELRMIELKKTIQKLKEGQR